MSARPYLSFSDLTVVDDRMARKGPFVSYLMLSSTLVAFHINVLA